MRTLPHLITIFRLLCSPVVAWLLFQGSSAWALAMVLLAGVSDWLDGYAARRLNASGRVGVVLDPLADKVLLTTLFVVLAVLGMIPMWMLCLAIGRDLVIVFGALTVRIFRGIHRFLPTMLGKVSTFFQIVLVLLAMAWAAHPDVVLLWLKVTALALSAFFTLLSGLDYIRIGIEMARRRYRPNEQAV